MNEKMRNLIEDLEQVYDAYDSLMVMAASGESESKEVAFIMWAINARLKHDLSVLEDTMRKPGLSLV